MTQNGNIYTADKGKLIVRKKDDYVMGESIDLGSADKISNYTEKAFSEEEIANYRKEWGIPDQPVPEKRGKVK